MWKRVSAFRSIYQTALITIVIGLFFASAARAELSNIDEMHQVCRNWLTYCASQPGGWAGSTSPSISGFEDITANDTLLARCYSISPVGFVIVPVLKELSPIKAYSDESDLNPSDTLGLAQLLREMLHDRVALYIDTYGALDQSQPTSGPVLLDRKHRAAWDELAIPSKTFSSSLSLDAAGSRVTGGPLLTTTWHQGWPYYNYCPLGNGDARTYVGCVATAMAQILAYWQWPTEGGGYNRYWWTGEGSVDPGFLYAEYWDSYDWDNIVNDCVSGCDSAQQAALAELNYEAAVSVNMDFGTSGSGTQIPYVMSAFKTFFYYKDDVEMQYRANHSPVSWFNIIKDEIDAWRPMEYGIMSHAIVCDGWRMDGEYEQYHMNYGWGGAQNAWYFIDYLYCDWSGCDYFNESLVRYIEPDKSVMFTADPKVGQCPLEVSFEGSSELAVDAWNWDFGDSTTASIQSLQHTYLSGGVYDVALEVTSNSLTYARTKQEYVIALADSLIAVDVDVHIHTPFELVIHAANVLDLSVIDLPIEYGGTLIITLDSISTAGCRTDGFEGVEVLDDDPAAGRLMLRLVASYTDTSVVLGPGNGDVVKLYFTLDESTTGGQWTIFELDGYQSGADLYQPGFHADLIPYYQPIIAGATVACVTCCVTPGDANHDGYADISDLTLYIDFMFGNGDPPQCMEEFDNNGDCGQDISDLTYFVDYMFGGGAPAVECHDCSF